MVEEDNNTMEFIKSRVELASPGTDWEESWRKARLKGLGPEVTSFLWKLLHKLLPSEQRLARILPNISDLCKYCPNPPPADLHHCFFECIKTQNVSRSLVGALRHHDPLVTTEGLLRLELRADGVKEAPLVWITAHSLNYLWKTRSGGKVADLILTRAMLESQINILRETRYYELVPMLEEILENLI